MRVPFIPTEDRPTLTSKDVARILKIGLTTARKLMKLGEKNGGIKSVMVGDLRRATPRALQEYLLRIAKGSP